MAKGNSGRVVIEMKPDLKNDLYSALARDNKTLKDWFIKNAEDYIEFNQNLPLTFRKKDNDKEK